MTDAPLPFTTTDLSEFPEPVLSKEAKAILASVSGNAPVESS